MTIDKDVRRLAGKPEPSPDPPPILPELIEEAEQDLFEAEDAEEELPFGFGGGFDNA